MARVVAFIPDLLFGSNVAGALAAAGHDVRLVSGLADERELAEADVLIVDLTADAPARIAAIPAQRPPALAFYSHVEQDVRELAQRNRLMEVMRKVIGVEPYRRAMKRRDAELGKTVREPVCSRVEHNQGPGAPYRLGMELLKAAHLGCAPVWPMDN